MYPATIMLKPASADCNLDCSYCFYLHRPGDPYQQRGLRRMSTETLEAVMRAQFQAARGRPLNFLFQGGEPTLAGKDFFARAGELVRRLRAPQQTVSLAVQTNGILVDEAFARLFKAYGYLVGVSLDGAARFHDAYRRNLGGRGSHARVVEAIRLLREHGVSWNILTVVHAANVAHAAEVYRYLKDEIGARYMQFIPCVELRDGRPFPESITPQQYADFLLALFQAWRADGYGQVSIRLFDAVTNALYNGQPGFCVLQAACARALIVEYNGDAYPCDFYVREDQLLGNYHTHTVRELMAAEARLSLEREKGQLPAECLSCPYLRVCYGGCPKYRQINAALTGDAMFYFCPAYKALFERLLPVAGEFVASVIWREATPLERVILFGLAQLEGGGASPLPVSRENLRGWLAEVGESVSARQLEEALRALLARRVLSSPQRDQFTFEGDTLPVWIERNLHQAGLT